jgi:palmitoyltransferase
MLSLIACVSLNITDTRSVADKYQGLAYSTVTLIRHGHLTIDRERQKSHTRAQHAIEKLRAASQPIPADLEKSLRRFTDIHHFYVPVPDDPDRGHIIATLPTENPYDFGAKGNWRLIMGSGWEWLNPLRAIRRGMGNEIYNWPIAPGVEARLIAESKRHSETSAAQ